MSYFQWTNALSVDDPVLDQDHQHLIGLINELYGATEIQQDSTVLGQILQRLFEYTREHFAREEALMQKINFADFPQHVKQHQKLLERVVTLQAALAENREYVAKETAELLKFWLSSHIHMSDRALALAVENSKHL